MCTPESDYRTHLGVLEKLFSEHDIKTVFEFGPGRYSTKFFSDHCKEVVSAEMNSKDWFYQIEEMHYPNVTLAYLPGPYAACDYLAKLGQFDLIMVDGHGDSRHRQAQVALEHSKIVVCHDTNDAQYGWWFLRVPEVAEVVHYPTGNAHTSTIIQK